MDFNYLFSHGARHAQLVNLRFGSTQIGYYQKSEIRELSSNSNNIMADKLCLQLCGFLKFLARIQDVLFTKTNSLGTNKEINV